MEIIALHLPMPLEYYLKYSHMMIEMTDTFHSLLISSNIPNIHFRNGIASENMLIEIKTPRFRKNKKIITLTF